MSVSDLVSVPVTLEYDDLPHRAGERLGPTAWTAVTQPQVAGFADLTHDHQWIHVDEPRAKEGPFGTTIAHGYLTLSLVPFFLGQLLEVSGISMAVNYGLEQGQVPGSRPGRRKRAGVGRDRGRPAGAALEAGDRPCVGCL